MNYTVMGDAVNLASRIEGLGSAYGVWILVGETTAERVRDAMLLRPVDWVAVKGKSRAVLVHELLGERAEGDPREAAVARYREALDHYRARRWEEAEQAFAAAREAFGGTDGPSDVMIARCRAYAVDPPGEAWDGSTARKEK